MSVITKIQQTLKRATYHTNITHRIYRGGKEIKHMCKLYRRLALVKYILCPYSNTKKWATLIQEARPSHKQANNTQRYKVIMWHLGIHHFIFVPLCLVLKFTSPHNGTSGIPATQPLDSNHQHFSSENTHNPFNRSGFRVIHCGDHATRARLLFNRCGADDLRLTPNLTS